MTLQQLWNRDNGTLTLRQLENEGTAELRAAQIEEAGLDARYLLLKAFELDTAHFLLKKDSTLPQNITSDKAIEGYWNLIMKRAERIPLQHLTGVQEFMGLEFCVNEQVLIPRQDTETLVELVLSEQSSHTLRMLDLCTGSGCIAISLAVLGQYDDVLAIDISEEALKIAVDNADRLIPADNGRSRVTFLKSDLFEDIEWKQFDVIVSNPPYIATDIIASLEPEVREHEPLEALDGKEDGLYFYRRLALESAEYLKQGGSIYLEIGYDQGQAVTDLLKAAGFDEIVIVKDPAGLDRVVRGILTEEKKKIREVAHV